MANWSLLTTSKGKEFETYLEGKPVLTYTNNEIINYDFQYLLYFYNRGSFEMVNKLLNGIRYKTKAFYLDEHYTELKTLIQAYFTLRRFVQKKWKNKKTIPTYANDNSLDMLPFSAECISLTIDNKIYRFEITNMLKLWRFALYTIGSELFISDTLHQIRNPYTNVPFKLNELFSLYNELQTYFSNKKKSTPIWLVSFKLCYLDMELYHATFFKRLLKKSIDSYIEEGTEQEFMKDFMHMIRSDLDIHKYYCKRCYKRLQMKKIFKLAVTLYILNSNNIYEFGRYNIEFMDVIRTEGLMYTKNHYKIHRRRVKAKRTDPSIVNINLTTHPFG